LTVKLAEAAARLRQWPVKPLFQAERCAAALASFDFAAPRPLDDCIDFAIAELEGGIVHKTHPRYFGLFNPAPTFPSECADRIVGAFNPQPASATTSPAAGGWQGYGEHIDRATDHAQMLREEMISRGWSIVYASRLAVVCLEPPAGSAAVATIAERVVRSGCAWVSCARFEGRSVLRACITHGETSSNDVAALASVLHEHRLPLA